VLIVELSPGQLDWERLTSRQKAAVAGVYAQAMAGFVQYVASRYKEIKAQMREELGELREAASRSGQHKRTPAIVANLALDLRYFLDFALHAGAISYERAEGLWQRWWKALGEAAARQSQHEATQEPARRFLELLSAAITSGRAHVADPEGEEPGDPEAWGWRFYNDEWRPQGERVGWVDGEDLYLQPEAAYAAVQKQGRDSGDPLAVTGRTLSKRLNEGKVLLSTDSPHLTVRRVLQGKRLRVLHLSIASLSYHAEKVGQLGHEDEAADGKAEKSPPLWPTKSKRIGPPTRPWNEKVGHGPLINKEVAQKDPDNGAAPDPNGPDGPDETETSFRDGNGVRELPVEELANNVSQFLAKIEGVLRETPDVMADFKFAELEVTAEVSAEGKLSLLGTGAGVSAKGGLTFRFERNSS
jgi:hypothetical protein